MPLVRPGGRMDSELAWTSLEDEPADLGLVMLDIGPAEDVAEERARRRRVVRVDQRVYRRHHQAEPTRLSRASHSLRQRRQRHAGRCLLRSWHGFHDTEVDTVKHPVALYLMTTARSVDDPFGPSAARRERTSG